MKVHKKVYLPIPPFFEAVECLGGPDGEFSPKTYATIVFFIFLNPYSPHVCTHRSYAVNNHDVQYIIVDTFRFTCNCC
jgi:hypothetical protein